MSKHLQTRRGFLGAAAALAASPLFAAAGLPVVEVWKSPTCGCCAEWVAHLESAGFRVVTHDTGNSAIRRELGMPIEYGSCHTARVDGYVVEGHVPAADVRRLLETRPRAVGLAVPRMPIGSPGMDGPAYGGRVDPYDVLLVGADGRARVFSSYGR